MMVSCDVATGANQFTRQTSVVTPEFAVDKPKLTLSSASNNPAISMQNVLTFPKTMWLLKPGQNLATQCGCWFHIPNQQQEQREHHICFVVHLSADKFISVSLSQEWQLRQKIGSLKAELRCSVNPHSSTAPTGCVLCQKSDFWALGTWTLMAVRMLSH